METLVQMVQETMKPQFLTRATTLVPSDRENQVDCNRYHWSPFLEAVTRRGTTKIKFAMDTIASIPVLTII